MDIKIINTPKRIYLNLDFHKDEYTNSKIDFNTLKEVTWSETRMNDTDIEFIQREDLKDVLLRFFLFFRVNGEKFLGMSIEQFINEFFKKYGEYSELNLKR